MQVNNDTTITVSSLKSAPAIPAVPLPAGQVADIGNAENRTRQDRRSNPSGSPARFRSVLDAATVAGLGQASAKAGLSSTGVTQPETEVTRAGKPSREINAQDSEALFRAVRAYALTAKKTADRPDDVAQYEAKPVFKHVALSASRRYAESFFALDRTFATRGETLEVST
jgi:hypothetical protein